MRVVVSGSNGLIGGALVGRLEQRGQAVTRLVRRSPGRDREVQWDPRAGRLDAAAVEGFDAVIHLAGESVAAGRWSAQRKAEIRDSRVNGTRLLASRLATLAEPPKVLLAASAIGIYGSRGDAEQTESSPPGSGFLAEVCRSWEAACEPAAEKGVRVVNLRFGLVLASRGGALARMLPAFKLGLGGRVGDGEQWMSWITLEDVLRIVEWALDDGELRGAVNVVSPQPVRQVEFAEALGRVLHRPTLLPLPAFVLRALFGEMAEELLLASTRVSPRLVTTRGYRFAEPELEGALRSLLSQLSH